jgi:hypothetical protein
MKRISVMIVMIIAAGLLMTPGCKKGDNQVFDIEGDWVFTITSHDGTQVTVNFTFSNLSIFTGGNEVGRYALRIATVNMEMTRPLDSGTTVDEAYFGFFDSENYMTGTMTRYTGNGEPEGFTWTAQR